VAQVLQLHGTGAGNQGRALSPRETAFRRAASGDESLTTAQRDHPGAILLDIRRPRLDDIDTYRGLKRDEKTWHIPVMVTTAYQERVLEVFDAEADHLVTEPFHLEELAVRDKPIGQAQHLTDELERAMAYIGDLREDLPRL
jgi:CheY-like chemotaxis protein